MWPFKKEKEVGEDFVLVSHNIIKEELKGASSSEIQRLETILAVNSIITSDDYYLLTNLGFSNTPDIEETGKQQQMKRSAEETLRTLKRLEELGFIAITSEFLVTNILEKYNLVCGPANAFKKNIPAENVRELAETVRRYQEKRCGIVPSESAKFRDIEVAVVSPIFDFEIDNSKYSLQNRFVKDMPEGDPIIFIKDIYFKSLYIYATGWDVEKDIFLKEYKEFTKNRKEQERGSIYDDDLF